MKREARGRAARAILMAASIASAPLLAKTTRLSAWLGAKAASNATRFASRAARQVLADCCGKASSRLRSVKARTKSSTGG